MKCWQCAMKMELLERELQQTKGRETELTRINNALTRAIMAQPYTLSDHLWKEKYEQQAERNVQLCKLLLANGQDPEPILKMKKEGSRYNKKEERSPSECATAKKNQDMTAREYGEQTSHKRKKVSVLKSCKNKHDCKTTL